MSTEAFNFYPDKSYLSLVTRHLSLVTFGLGKILATGMAPSSLWVANGTGQPLTTGGK